MKRLHLSVGLLALMVGFSAALANASPVAASGACTDSWLGGSGNWFVASNWSSGAVPGPNDAVCITAPGDYSVTVPGGPTGPGAGQAVADTLQLGAASGTQKLVLQADNSCGNSTGAGGLEVYDHASAATAASIGANGQMQLTQNSNTCSGSANDSHLRVDNGELSNAGLITTDTGGVAASEVTGRLIRGSISNLGGTIEVDTNTTWSGANFDNAGGLSFPGTSVLTVPTQGGATFTNDAGGTIISYQPTGHLFVDHGNTFRQGAGMANPAWSRPGADPAVIIHGATINYTGNGRSNIEVEGQATLTGDVPSQALLAIECSGSEDAVLHASSFTNAGFIGLYGTNPGTCSAGRTLSVDSGAGPGTGTLTNTGRIEGYGTIAGNINNTSGSILPGDSFHTCTPCTGAYTPGLITVTGNYAQSAGGTFGEVNVNNCSPCAGPGIDYSQLSVQGDASLDGTLDMLTGGVTRPAAGDAYQVLSARSVTGRFTTLKGQLDPSLYGDVEYVPAYNPTNVTVGVVKLHPKLTVAMPGAGSGRVTSSPVGIACGTTCTALFSRGHTITLAAAPAPGSKFAGWSGAGCSGTGTCSVTMNSDTTVTATFTRPPRCTLRLQSRRVKLNLRKPHGARHVTGTLTAIVVCDHPARLKLLGTVTESLASRRNPHTKRFRLRPMLGAASSARATTLVVTLPTAALRALRHRDRETIKLTLLATGVGGTTRISTRRRPIIGPRNHAVA